MISEEEQLFVDDPLKIDNTTILINKAIILIRNFSLALKVKFPVYSTLFLI